MNWELLLAGLIGVLIIFLFRPGVKAALEHSRQAPKDWKGALLPLAVVVLFVLLLIALVR